MLRENEELGGEKGATMLEYAMLASLMAVVAIAAVSYAGQQVATTFDEIGSQVASAHNPGGGTGPPTF